MAKKQYNKQGYKSFYGTTTLTSVSVGTPNIEQVVGANPCRFLDGGGNNKSFTVVFTPNVVNETDMPSTTAVFRATGYDDGIYYYRITGIQANDVDVLLEGTINIVNGIATLVITATEDFLTEGDELATLTVFEDAARQIAIGVGQFTIIDTSQSPFYNVTVADNGKVTTIAEGDTTTTEVITNEADGTILYYDIYGTNIDSEDFENGFLLQGSAVVSGGKAQIQVPTVINRDAQLCSGVYDDYSGNNRDLTPINNPTIAAEGVTFNGSNQYAFYEYNIQDLRNANSGVIRGVYNQTVNNDYLFNINALDDGASPAFFNLQNKINNPASLLIVSQNQANQNVDFQIGNQLVNGEVYEIYWQFNPVAQTLNVRRYSNGVATDYSFNTGLIVNQNGNGVISLGAILASGNYVLHSNTTINEVRIWDYIVPANTLDDILKRITFVNQNEGTEYATYLLENILCNEPLQETAIAEWYTDPSRTNSVGTAQIIINDRTPQYELVETFSVTSPEFIQSLPDNGYTYGRIIDTDTNLYRRSFNGINSAAVATIPIPNVGAEVVGNRFARRLKLKTPTLLNATNFGSRDGFEIDLNTNTIAKRINDATPSSFNHLIYDSVFDRYIGSDQENGIYEINSAFTTSTKRTTLTRANVTAISSDYYFIVTQNNQTLARVNRTDFSGLIQTPTLGGTTRDVVVYNNQYVVVVVQGVGFRLYDLNLVQLNSINNTTAFLDAYCFNNLLYVSNTNNWQVYDISQGTFNLLYQQNVGTQNRGISANNNYVYIADTSGNAIRIYQKTR